MTDDLIALSRLLDGELSEADAAALQRRIASEPALAEAWQTMCALPAGLAALGDDAPPPGLDAAVLAQVSDPLPARRAPSWTHLALAAAAAAALALLAPTWLDQRTTLTLLDGRQEVRGHAEVLVPGARVEVDGVALVDVEPASARTRSAVQEDPMKTHLLSAAAGAALTVAVIEGSAWIWPDAEATPIEVKAGDTHVVPAAAPAAAPRPAVRPAAVASAAVDDHVQDYIDGLEAEVARLTFENTLVKGQLETHTGVAQPWPEDVHPLVRPEAFTARLTEAVAGIEGATLHDVRCDEYPCLGIVTATGAEPQLKQMIVAIAQAMEAGAPDGELGNMISAGISKDSDDPDDPGILTLGVATMDAREGGQDSDPRLQQRMVDAEDEVQAAMAP